MLIKPASDIKPSEITPESVYRSRRRFMAASFAAAGTAAALPAGALPAAWLAQREVRPGQPIGEDLTPERDATRYNNFYEFGTDKGDPAAHAHEMTVDPWTVNVTGAVAKPGRIDIGALLSGIDLEERIYRLRCVEAWSMVIPWIGFPVKKLLDKFEPAGDAKYVAFKTLHRPAEMRGQRSLASSIDWPYVEGLRLDEANHPLAIFAVGMYGKVLPNQNGAPLRLVVPWEVRLQEHQVHRGDPPHRIAAADHMEPLPAARVRLLLQRESERRSTRAGAKPRRSGCRRGYSRHASRRACSTGTTKWLGCTRAWISAATSSGRARRWGTACRRWARRRRCCSCCSASRSGCSAGTVWGELAEPGSTLGPGPAGGHVAPSRHLGIAFPAADPRGLATLAAVAQAGAGASAKAGGPVGVRLPAGALHGVLDPFSPALT